MQNTKDSMFALVEASKLSLDDKFMQHKPTMYNQRKLKESLTEAIESGISDFWASKLDPSFSEDGTGLIFEPGKMPAVGKSYNWWEEKAKLYLPERGSYLGTKIQYVAFLGVLIKNLVARGWPMSKAWYAVCEDSTEFKHYWNSEHAKHDFEVTGSKEICGFCDLVNTYKILAWDKEAGGMWLDGSYHGAFWLAGGGYNNNGVFDPLAYLNYCAAKDNENYRSIGWIVLLR